MAFLPDVHETCETCRGTGHLAEVWEVNLSGIALPELYAFTLNHVMDLFGDIQSVGRPLKAAQDVGLGYLALRQPWYSLSGGEAQRLKIAAELCRKVKDGTLYILDEPTVGQHMQDVHRLVDVLQRLVEGGHSVLVIEHHPHLLAACDWLIELGPGGGPEGGEVVGQGPPRELASGGTPIAGYIREVLDV
jgi:excinuclease ABC subunit A